MTINNAPGFVDLQVNGYAGIDFNCDGIDTYAIHRACERLKSDGVAQVLATVITDDLPAMCRRIKSIVRSRDEDTLIADVVAGIHIEGPFLNDTAGFIGAHPPEFAQDATVDAMNRLLEAANGLTRIVTLAPERDPDCRVIRHLSNQGIVVSAGHCDPSLDELKGAIDAGLSMFTHLGNGCPLHLHRHDNIIQRVLSVSKDLMIGFIADGVHIPLTALRNYITCAGLDRSFVVTDAIAAAGQGAGEFELAGQKVIVDEMLATWSADRSHLVGSASTMPRIVDNLRTVGFDPGEISKLTFQNPRKAVPALAER